MITGQATLQKSQALYEFAVLVLIPRRFLVGFSLQIIAVCYLLLLVLSAHPSSETVIIQLIKTRCLLLSYFVVLKISFYHSTLLLCSNISFSVHLCALKISKMMK